MKKNSYRGLVVVTLLLFAHVLLSGCAGTVVSPDAGATKYVVLEGPQTADSVDAGGRKYAVPRKKSTLAGNFPKTARQAHVRQGETANLSDMDIAFKNSVSKEDYERFVEKYKPVELAFVAVQRLAKPHLNTEEWKKAEEIFVKYKSDFPGKEGKFETIIDLLRAPSQDLSVTNLGPGINTPGEEYQPVLAADEKLLFYSRDIGANGGENIFVSSHDGAQWSAGIDMGQPINTSTHEVPLGISFDGNILTLFGNYSESFGRGDIFFAEKQIDCWSEIKHYPAPINTTFFESNAMLVSDGTTMLLTSERPGGEGEFHKKGEFFHGGIGGNTDIYAVIETENGLQTINLGVAVNTPYSEYSPYLHADGKTLYFSSDGHPGLGGLDVFKSTRLSDTSWTEWSKPVNLGKDINGPEDDWGYQVATSGKLAYFATNSRNEGYGGNDIYTTKLPVAIKVEKVATVTKEPETIPTPAAPVVKEPETVTVTTVTMQPNAVTTVSGRVLDPIGNPISDATIVWNDLTLNKRAGKAASAPGSGEYFIALPAGHMFGFYADKANYIGKSENLDLTDKAEFTEYTLDIILFPVEKLVEEKVVIRMNNIFFDFNKADLKEESIFELERWVKFLTLYSNISTEFQGHADWVGSDDYNQKLSERRAQSVVNYLVEHGVKADLVTAVGFGESMPVASNETEEGRAKNRRVEIHFKTTVL